MFYVWPRHVADAKGKFFCGAVIVCVTGGETGTKNHEVREVPLFPAMAAFLLKLKAVATTEDKSLVIGISSAKNAIEQACKRAALPSFTHHSMRHYFVSNAIERDIDFEVRNKSSIRRNKLF